MLRPFWRKYTGVTPIIIQVPGNLWNRFGATPRGIIFHGTRSGQPYSVEQEFQATLNYVRAGAGGLGWNATIGNDKIAIHGPATHWGWNARDASRNYLALEFAQPTAAVDITPAQIRAAAFYIATYAPHVPRHWPSHAEVERWGETGQIDGKSDVYPYGDPRMDQLRSAVATLL